MKVLMRRGAGIFDKRHRIAAVRRFTRGGLDAHVGRNAGDEQVLALKTAKKVIKAGRGKSPHRGLANDGIPGFRRQLLDDPEPPAPPIDDPGLRNGLRVAGLPANLDEVQVKQLLSHFGPLSTFTLQRTAFSGTALLSYQDPAVAKDACASLHGIPLGGR